MATPVDTLKALQEELSALLARLSSLRQKEAAYTAAADEWYRKWSHTVPSRKDGNDLVQEAENRRLAAAAKAEAVEVEKSIATVRSQITQAEKDIQTFNAALSDAARNGLTGAAAEEAAKAHVENAKTRRTVITVACIVLGLALLVWLWYKFIRKKKA